MSAWVSTADGRHLRGRRKTDTEPELLLRRALHAQGARFRLHRTLATGCTPDLVLPSRRIAVFVDGDYWHSCPAHGRTTPFTGPNAALWDEKMARNRERDRLSTQAAHDAGWTVVRVWECTIRADAGHAARTVLQGRSPEPAWPKPVRNTADTG
jgi:DNA mismatch endonuclease (patch repair protein)